MWSIFFAETGVGTDELLTGLWERGTKGVIEEAGGLRAFFEDEVRIEDMSGLAGDNGAPVIRAEATNILRVELDDWDPISVGERFYIASPHAKQTVPDGRLWLKIDSPTAFGTGRHETTQLCLQAMERSVKPGHSVADVGCGSGILSAAARLLGAGSVWSCDIGTDAIEAARRTVHTPVFLGSADALASDTADLVVANISAKVLDRLAFDLRRVVKRDGIVIICGFVAGNLPQCFSPVNIYQLNDWLCWICEPGGIAPNETSIDLTHEEHWWL